MTVRCLELVLAEVCLKDLVLYVGKFLFSQGDFLPDRVEHRDPLKFLELSLHLDIEGVVDVVLNEFCHDVERFCYN